MYRLAVVKSLHLLGTRGLPAAHGGFETAAEQIAVHLRDSGWAVSVYCQLPGWGPLAEYEWNGIRLVNVPSGSKGSFGSIVFDIRSVARATRDRGVHLTFGYNSAFLNMAQWITHVPNVINMDGVEWARKRWGIARRAYLWANDRLARIFAAHLVADHPEIETYLKKATSDRRISMIAYGARAPHLPDRSQLQNLELTDRRYLTVIARPILENSILEIVEVFSSRPRGVTLVVLGRYDSSDSYQSSVVAAASAEVMFPGAIYDQSSLDALRYYSIAYVHGHTVGGTNPSLVEALGAGNAIIAQDNKYNRWVAGRAAIFFSNSSQLESAFDSVINDESRRRMLAEEARSRHQQEFTWDKVTAQYESLLLGFVEAPGNG